MVWLASVDGKLHADDRQVWTVQGVNPVSELRAWRQEEAKEAYLINLWNMHMCGVIVPHEGFMELFGVAQGWCYHGGRPIKIKG